MIKSFKLFESELLSSNDINYHLQVIKDVFKDIIDDYDLYRWDINSLEENAFYYDIYHSTRYEKLCLRIFYSENGHFVYSDVIKNIDISKNIKRLESIGYKVERNDSNFIGTDHKMCIDLDINI